MDVNDSIFFSGLLGAVFFGVAAVVFIVYLLAGFLTGDFTQYQDCNRELKMCVASHNISAAEKNFRVLKEGK